MNEPSSKQEIKGESPSIQANWHKSQLYIIIYILYSSCIGYIQGIQENFVLSNCNCATSLLCYQPLLPVRLRLPQPLLLLLIIRYQQLVNDDLDFLSDNCCAHFNRCSTSRSHSHTAGAKVKRCPSSAPDVNEPHRFPFYGRHWRALIVLRFRFRCRFCCRRRRRLVKLKKKSTKNLLELRLSTRQYSL